MDSHADYPWAAIHEFLLDCGKAKRPKELAVKALEGVNAFVPFDQGRIYSINADGEVYDDILFSVDKRWPSVYYDYYSQILDGKYSLSKRLIKGGFSEYQKSGYGVYDWTNCKEDEFVADYIRPQGLRYNFSFALYDTEDFCRRICMMDRTGGTNFTKREQEILSLIIPHVENLHRNYYAGSEDECAVGRKVDGEALTARESEIAELICKGFSPEAIAKRLYVSRATVYKHIAHIHSKIGVSSCQELIVKLLHSDVIKAAC